MPKPGDYGSITPTNRSGHAVRQILGHLLAALRANTDGVIQDRDPAPLHDLRVAVRRARSALGQLEGVLPTETVGRLAADLEWLGELTGPCRDLDVWLLDLDLYRGALPPEEAASLAPLETRVLGMRDRAHAELVLALSSPRFQRLLDGWESCLSAEPGPAEAPPDADTPVKVLADRRIAKAYDRLLHRCLRLGKHPTARALHRLRIAAKKLRYLLEFFRSLYPTVRIAPLITRLKAVQDILGELNDVGVQRKRLATMTREQEGAMNNLEVHLDRRREELLAVLHDSLDATAGAAAQRKYRALVGDGSAPHP